jgi:hypothetical protein
MPTTVLANARLARTAAALLLCAAPGAAAPPAAADPVVLNANRYDVLAGRYSVFAKFQAALQRVLEDCGKPAPPVVRRGAPPSGRIGRETQQGILRALECPALEGVSAGSPARQGMLTEAVWRAVMGAEPLPTTRERADALVLSFEGTDFGDPPEWNLCQDNKPSALHQSHRWAPGFRCYNASDPCSLLTWGPRGATAGFGREIQLVLWMVWKEDPALVRKAFGAEADNLQRFFRLRGDGGKNCYVATPLKRFLCAIWMDPARSKRWEAALEQLGHEPRVRDAYARLYAFKDFDGDKLRAFFELWHRLGLAPSEVDYAFFLDRITHLGGPPRGDAEVDGLKACVDQEHLAISRNARVRRCLARLQPHETQPQLRLARDVAYYLDAYPEGALSAKEIKAWGGYVPLSAIDTLGLSEARSVSIGEAQPLAFVGPDVPLADSSDLTPAERKVCPGSVLSPIPRRPPD